MTQYEARKANRKRGRPNASAAASSPTPVAPLDPWQQQLEERLAALSEQVAMMMRLRRFDSIAAVVDQARSLCGSSELDDPDAMLIADLPNKNAARWAQQLEQAFRIRTVGDFLAQAGNVKQFLNLPNFRRETLAAILTLIQQTRQRRRE